MQPTLEGLEVRGATPFLSQDVIAGPLVSHNASTRVPEVKGPKRKGTMSDGKRVSVEYRRERGRQRGGVWESERERAR